MNAPQLDPAATAMPARRLAVVPRPAEGEFLGSWVDRVAARYGTSSGNAARWLGIECRVGVGGSTLRPRFYGVALTAASRAGLTASTGLPGAVFDGMCLSRFAATALDFTGLDLFDDRSAVPMLRREWALFTTSRACPLCLADSGGVWPVWWRLGVAAACVRHQVLLVDTCPLCGLPLRRGHTNRGSGVSRRQGADPLRCGNSGPTATAHNTAGPCPQRIDEIAMVSASAELVAAQHAVLDIAEGAHAPMVGVHASAREWFRGLRFVLALHRMFASPTFVAERPGMPPQAAEAFAVAASRRTGAQALRVRIPPNAAHAAADLLLSYPVLACADPGTCAGLLMPVAEAEAAMLEAASNRQDRMWAVQRPEILDRVWRAIRRSRHRRFDPAVCRVPRSASAAGLGVRHIPHLIDAKDYRELLGPLLPELTETTGRRLAAAACARVLGARSWAGAATAVDMAHHSDCLAQRTSLVRRLPDEGRFWDGIAQVMDRLFTRGPIDYAARRFALADLVEVPATLVTVSFGGSRVRVTSRQCRFAAAWIWAELTNGDMADAPAMLAVPTRGPQRRRDSSARRWFVARLQAPAADAFRRHGMTLLASKGIA